MVSPLGSLFTVVEVAEPLKTRQRTSHRAIRERQLKAHGVGLSSRILEADLQAWTARMGTA
jgi:excisionase family DNA binding protein